MATTVTAKDVAAWMLSKLQAGDFLYQETVVYEIAQKFGDAFTHTNQNGNMAINKEVLDAFRKSSGDDVIWERGERLWRKRKDYDAPGRQQS